MRNSGTGSGPPFAHRPLDSGGAISNSRLISGLHRRILDVLFAACVLGIVYLSLVPFDFQSIPTGDLARGTRAGMTAVRFNLPDILANICYYAPIGLLGYAAARNWGVRRSVAFVVVLGFAMCLSMGIERGQRYLASRVASWTDVYSNVAGAMLGLVSAALGEGMVRRLVSRGREALRRDWWGAMATGMVCALLVIQTRPYDVATDPVRTAARLRHADFSPLARWRALNADTQREIRAGRASAGHQQRAKWEYVTDRVADTAAYAALGALCVAAYRRRGGSRPVRSAAWSVFVCASLAAMVTGIRVLLNTRGLDTAHFFCGAAGGLIGAIVGRFCFAPPNMAAKADKLSRTWVVVSPTWRWGTALLVIAVSLSYSLAPFDVGTSDPARTAAAGRWILRPFVGHFQTRPPDAIWNISTDLLQFGVLAGAMVWCLGGLRWNWRLRTLAALGIAMIVAVVCEATHLWMASRYTDVTTIILAAVGAGSGVVFVRWFDEVQRALSVGEVDDALTRSLTEGKGYDKGALAELAQRASEARNPIT